MKPYRGQDSSVSIVIEYGLDDWGSILKRQEICLFTTVSRPSLGLTQPSIQWILKALSLWVK
jgi:hypothetical protein